jgi:hypothetical protein
MEKKTIGLDEVLTKYGVPDPKIIGKLPKGGQQLSFVGHADVTKMLLEVDESWTWEPTAFDSDGLPAYRVENGMAHMAGWMTVHGVRRLGVGSCLPNKPDLLKELISDLIRNCGMRFGFCLSLWTRQEWEDLDHSPASSKPRPSAPASAPEQAPKQSKPKTLTPLSQAQIDQFNTACEAKGITPSAVAANAGIPEGTPWMESHLPALRSAFKELASFKDGE